MSMYQYKAVSLFIFNRHSELSMYRKIEGWEREKDEDEGKENAQTSL